VTGELVQEDWKMTWNVPLEKSGVLVSKSVLLDIEVQAVRQAEEAAEAAEAESLPEDRARAKAEQDIRTAG
jgi:hypothetical protein